MKISPEHTLKEEFYASEGFGRSQYIFRFLDKIIKTCIEAEQKNDVAGLIQLMVYLYRKFCT